MLAACLLGSALLQPPPDADRARQVLANGARLVAQKTASPGELRLVMAASLHGVGLLPDQHGWAHLLEHIAAKGPAKNVDARLEAQGMALSVETTRDSMVFEIVGPPELASLALDVLREIAGPLSVTPEELAKEMAIIRQEQALLMPSFQLGAAAWEGVFGADGLDPFGAVAAMDKASPDDLKALHARMFRGAGVSISAAGDLAPRPFLERMKSRFESLPRGAAPEPPLRSAARPTEPILAETRGSARAVIIEGIDTSAGLAALGAALAASRWTGSAPVFSPTVFRSLIVLPASGQGAFAALDGLTSAQRQAMHGEVQALAANWVATARRVPARLARLNAELALQNPTLTPDRLVELALSIDARQADEALAAFTRDRAILVEGAR